MKPKRLLMALMLFVTISVSAQEHSVSVNTRETIENGTIEIPDKLMEKGKVVKVYCNPDEGYGMSRGLFYVKKNKDGGYSEPDTAKCESTYPDDRSQKLEFTFVMPDADVEVWAFFVPLRTLVAHSASGGKMIPLYGYKDSQEDSLLRNVPTMPLKFKVVPDTVVKIVADTIRRITYELVDLKLVNVDASYCTKTPTEVTVIMPNVRQKDIVHVTPVFGKSNYDIKINGDEFIQATLSDSTPKTRQEVELVLMCDKGYIPANVSIAGCKSWWRVGKPQRQKDGRWMVTYRFKVDFEDVTISFDHEKVYAFNINDTKNTERLETYVPEMIPDFPGMAREGQQIPVIFSMPKNFTATAEVKGAKQKKAYHNQLKNSFADQGMTGWKESNDYLNAGLAMMADVDSTGNYFWRTSVKNSMSQRIVLNSQATGKLSVAALASINPHYAATADVNLEVKANGKTTSVPVASLRDLENRKEGWQTVFKMTEIDAKATELQLVVTAEADDQNGKYSYGGPMFDDLCVLLPTADDSIRNEDVLIFTVGTEDVTIDYTPIAQQNIVAVSQKAHAHVTLRNTNSGEEGDSIKAMENDIIEVKGTYDEGWALYDMSCKPTNSSATAKADYLDPDSLNLDARELIYHYIMHGEQNITVTPNVKVQKLDIKNNYGGNLTVNNDNPQAGEKVIVTVTPAEGCKLKEIKLTPAGRAVISADSVDAETGAGRYSFVMPTTQIKLTPEFIVPISTAEQFAEIDRQTGEFNLVNDIDLGTNWKKQYKLSGQLNGNGHQVTYAGTQSLFYSVNAGASIRHLRVNANVKGSLSYLGGITSSNRGTIEDCAVSGTVINTKRSSTASGVAGQNGPRGGSISHCHVICDLIDAPTVCGIAYQEKGSTITGNVFDGQFVFSNGHAYMICNGEKSSTISGNYYTESENNARAAVVTGATAIKPEDMTETAKRQSETYPVFANSILQKFMVYAVTTSKPSEVSSIDLSATSGVAGTIISGSVLVSGNNHLESITITAPDGSDPRQCTFIPGSGVDYAKNTDIDYSFSFVMPAHDALVTFKTQQGTLIYNAKQFVNINDKRGKFILARNLELNNWEAKVNLKGEFYGNGHTIKYEGASSFKGLFHKVRKNALLQGLYVIGMVEAGVDCAGIAYSNDGTIRDCHFSGRLTRINSPEPSLHRVAAIACNVGKVSLIDHCSATGELISAANQEAVDKSPLCVQSGAKITNSVWIDGSKTSQYQELFQTAEAERSSYPVFAQGIFDKISACLIVGNDTVRVLNGATIDELTLIDGEPFVCTAEAKVNLIVYKRKAMKQLEQWVLPFSFNRIAGDSQFEYHRIIEDNKLPEVGAGHTLALSAVPAPIRYAANEPWLVKSDGNDTLTYVLTNIEGPITVKPTYDNFIARYKSILDEGTFYATYDGIPAQTLKDSLMYVWDADLLEFVLPADTAIVEDIHPYRYYLQFYNVNTKSLETYENTEWARNYGTSSKTNAKAAPRRLASVVADGWQPIFLDPRQPQRVTARMLDYYEVAYLTDIRGEVVDEESNSPLSAVSLVYKLVDDRMELPAAIPLLVRAKRADAEPLVDAKTGAEIDSLLTLSYINMLMEDLEDDDDDADNPVFELPHYWCASFGNRLDVWHLPAPVKYADLSYLGAMTFGDNYYDQSFTYADEADMRITSPMSYCITVLNTDRFELLPLLGDRVNVEFIQPGTTTGIESLTAEPAQQSEVGRRIFNLNGQRVGESYKGLILQNGRKIIKR